MHQPPWPYTPTSELRGTCPWLVWLPVMGHFPATQGPASALQVQQVPAQPPLASPSSPHDPRQTSLRSVMLRGPPWSGLRLWPRELSLGWVVGWLRPQESAQEALAQARSSAALLAPRCPCPQAGPSVANEDLTHSKVQPRTTLDELLDTLRLLEEEPEPLPPPRACHKERYAWMDEVTWGLCRRPLPGRPTGRLACAVSGSSP